MSDLRNPASLSRLRVCPALLGPYIGGDVSPFWGRACHEPHRCMHMGEISLIQLMLLIPLSPLILLLPLIPLATLNHNSCPRSISSHSRQVTEHVFSLISLILLIPLILLIFTDFIDFADFTDFTDFTDFYSFHWFHWIDWFYWFDWIHWFWNFYGFCSLHRFSWFHWFHSFHLFSLIHRFHSFHWFHWFLWCHLLRLITTAVPGPAAGYRISWTSSQHPAPGSKLSGNFEDPSLPKSPHVGGEWRTVIAEVRPAAHRPVVPFFPKAIGLMLYHPYECNMPHERTGVREVVTWGCMPQFGSGYRTQSWNDNQRHGSNKIQNQTWIPSTGSGNSFQFLRNSMKSA